MGGGLIVLLAILVVLFLIFRGRLPGGKPPGPPEESPEEILKRRYAKGEIGREEYERMIEEVRRR